MRFVMVRSLLTYLSEYENEAHGNQSTVIGHVQLEKLHLICLSGIDQFVKGTRR